MITLDSIQSDLHSIEIKDASGQALNIDASGFLTVNPAGGSLTVDAIDLDIRNLVFATDKVDVSGSAVVTSPNSISTWKNTAETVTNAAAQIVATALAGRTKMIVQNLGNQDIYVGPAIGVTTVNGTKIPKGSSFSIDFEDDADIYAITPAGSSDVRVSEYAV